MPCWYYFHRPTHLAYHDFTTTIKPRQNLRRLLGLGHKFIPTPWWTPNGNSKYVQTDTLDRFRRDIIIKGHFEPEPIESDETYNPRLYCKSDCPPHHGKSQQSSNTATRLSKLELNNYFRSTMFVRTSCCTSDESLSTFKDARTYQSYNVTKTLDPPPLIPRLT
jgi:hypothetical protein